MTESNLPKLLPESVSDGTVGDYAERFDRAIDQVGQIRQRDGFPAAPVFDADYEARIDAVLDQRAQTQQQSMQASFELALRDDPNMHAEAQRIGQELGLAPDLVSKSLPVMQRVARARWLRSQRFEQDHPVLASKLSELQFARIAHDDAENLGLLERVSQNFEAGRLESRIGMLGERARLGVANEDEVRELAALESRIGKLSVASGPATWAARITGQMSRTIPRAFAVGTATGATYAGVAALAGSAGPQAAVPEEVVTMPGAFALGFGHGSTLALAFDSYRIAAGHSYLDMVRQGYDRDAAATVAGGVGAASALLEVAGVTKLAEPVKQTLRTALRESITRPTYGAAARQFAVDYAKSFVAETGTEMAQTLAELGGEELTRRLSADPELSSTVSRGETFEALANTATSIGQGMLLLSAPGPAFRFAHDSARARRALDSQEFVRNLADVAGRTKTKARAPDQLQAFLAQNVGDSAAERLHIARDRVLEAMRDAGIGKSEVRNLWPALADQLDESAEARDDVVVSTADYATRLAGTPFGDALLQDARTDADGMSGREAISFQENVEQLAQDARARVDVHQEEREEFVRSASVVEETIYKQAAAAQAMPAAHARAGAKLIRDFVAINARRLGMTPEEFHAAYPLSIGPGEGQSLTSGDRGRFFPDSMVIRLYEGADISTLLHESAHAFQHMTFQVVRRQLANPQKVGHAQMQNDVAELLDWFGIGSYSDPLADRIAQWDALGLEGQRHHHEAFARNFELWISEGKSPSLEQQSLFRRFAAWLRRAYQSIRDEIAAAFREDTGQELPALTSEVREVFGRMVASAEAIERAKVVREHQPLFETQEGSGMTPEEWDEYQERVQAADEEAVDELARRRVSEVRYLNNARSKALKQIQREQREKRKQIGDEVARQVAADPIYRAMFWLRTGKTRAADGTVRGGGTKRHRMSTEAVVAIAGSDAQRLKSMTAKGGLDPDIVAELFGISSGERLVRGLLAAPPMDDAIRARTDERMLEDHAELSDPAAVEQAVAAAVANEVRQRVVATEMQAVAEARQPVRVLLAAAKEAARREIGRRSVGELDARLHSHAAARASRAAREALQAGDLREVRRQLRVEMMQHALAREAAAARDEVRQAQRDFARLWQTDAKLGKSRDVAIVNAGRAVLSLFGLGAAERHPLEWMRQVSEFDPELFAELSRDVEEAVAKAKPWTELTFDEFGDLRELVGALWWRAQRDRQVVINGNKVEVEQVADRMLARLDEIGLPERRGKYGAPGQFQKLGNGLRQMRATVARTEHAMLSLDGDGIGVFTESIFLPVQNGAVAFRADQLEITEKLQQLIEAHDFGPPRKIEAPELTNEAGKPYVFGEGKYGPGKVELLGAVLHSGNTSNLYKLVGGRSWGELNTDGTVDTSRWDAFVRRMVDSGVLTRADFDFVQRAWDLVESLKAKAQRVHRELYGTYFREVEAQPFRIRFPDGSEQTYKGGYVPAKADRDLVQTAAEHDADALLELQRQMPAIPRGFTRARNEWFKRELDLDLRQLASHVDQVLLFVHMQPPVRDVLRVLNRQEVRNALERLDPSLRQNLLIPWLQRSGLQTTTQPGQDSPMFAGMNRWRANYGAAVMFFNLKNAAQNYTDVFAAMTKVPPRKMFRGIVERIRQGDKLTERIVEASPFMAERLGNQVYELRDKIQEIVTDAGPWKRTQAWFRRIAYVAQRVTQNHVDTITWHGAYSDKYEQDTRAGRSHERAHEAAVKWADSVVRTVGMDNNPESLSTWEAGSPLMKLLFQFQSYFINRANLVVGEGARRVREGQGAKGLAALALWAIVMPAITAEAVGILIDGEDLDEEDDGYADDVVERSVGAVVRNITAGVPVFGRAAQLTWDVMMDDQVWNDRMPAPPVVAVLQRGLTAVRDIDTGGSRNIHDALTLIATATGIPINRLLSPVLYAADVAAGEVEPTGPVDAVRGFVTGRASEASK